MTKYVGKRIVPVHCGVWDQNRNYEMLSIVLNMADGDSYIARREVPAGTVLSDQNYWMLHSLYSQQIKDMADELAAAEKRIMADNDATEAAINRKTDGAVSDMTRKTEDAERLTNTNKAELNARMDNMEKRLDANVTAHTTPSGDFAAEVVDARVDEADFTHPSSGDALRSVGRNRQMLNALEGWTWKENYIVNEYGVLLPTPNWCCAHMIPVAGRRILISGCFSRMSGKAEYNNIVCFDRDKKYLGGCFRSEDSGTHYDGQVIELLDGTVFISVTTGSSIAGDAKVYLPEDCRPSQLLENYATAWQWMNGAVEIDFTAADVAVRFMTTCFLCRRVNGTKYVQNALYENDSFSGGCSTAGWWAVYYQEPGVENRGTDSGSGEENAGRTLIHAEAVGPDWGHLFTADRFVIAVLYGRHVVYAAPSNNGTIIQGIDYGNPAKAANTALSYGGQLGKTIFLV